LQTLLCSKKLSRTIPPKAEGIIPRTLVRNKGSGLTLGFIPVMISLIKINAKNYLYCEYYYISNRTRTCRRFFYFLMSRQNLIARFCSSLRHLNCAKWIRVFRMEKRRKDKNIYNVLIPHDKPNFDTSWHET
jgi:hypothetical protein